MREPFNLLPLTLWTILSTHDPKPQLQCKVALYFCFVAESFCNMV